MPNPLYTEYIEFIRFDVVCFNNISNIISHTITNPLYTFGPSAEAVEYTDCFSPEG